MSVTTEKLAYWYFRLNGFLTIEDFVVHVGLPGDRQGTDVDILGVRFPYRSELKHDKKPMFDDERLILGDNQVSVVLAEVKRSMCALNGPWTNQTAGNMQRVLYALGTLPEDQIDEAAKALYDSGAYSNEDYYVSLVCVGESENPELKETKPAICQITWDSILAFIYRRFIDFEKDKRPHPQWDAAGKYLWEQAIKHKQKGVQSFKAEVRKNI